VSGLPGVQVLLADAHLLVVDKPAGRLVIPGRGGSELSLREELEALYGRLWVVHRLDRGTSGVLVFARTAEAHRSLNIAFDRGEPRKRYLALVRGVPTWTEEIRLDVPLAPARRGRMRPVLPGDPRGKPSVTVVRCLEVFPLRPWMGAALSLVEALPETGRTHQIRVHLAAAGHPLAVDPDYGSNEPLLGLDARTLIARTPLHAAALTLAHPVEGRPLSLLAELPKDLAATLAALREGERPRR
jgi:tRNA pseudouridine32 synthase / 23S rRNA pseudouridine746 synthase